MDTGQFPCLSDTSTLTDSTSGSVGVSTLDRVTEVFLQCLCICTTQSNISTDVLQQKISQIKKNLTIAKTSLSSSLRKKISAQDMRQSSFTMGIVGTCYRRDYHSFDRWRRNNCCIYYGEISKDTNKKYLIKMYKIIFTYDLTINNCF